MYNVFDVVSKHTVNSRNDVFNEYVKTRAWSDQTINEWGIGYFPKTELLSLKVGLVNSGGKYDDLEDTGIIRKKKSLFFDRIIFPIHDTWGKCIAIAGRTLNAQIKPKYYNTFFEKTKVLYGLHRAIDHILATGRVIVFEGYADVVTAHQHGIKNAVCCMGTTLSEHHMILLSRYAKEIVLMFDNDDGGLQALSSFNKKMTAYDSKKEIKIYRCRINNAKDMDEYLNKFGPEAAIKYIDESISNPKEQERLRILK
jgi:DNA primase